MQNKILMNKKKIELLELLENLNRILFYFSNIVVFILNFFYTVDFYNFA